MIPDILSEALEEIECCQRKMPEVYGDPEMTLKIEVVKAAMRGLRNILATPPTHEQVERPSRTLSPMG